MPSGGEFSGSLLMSVGCSSDELRVCLLAQHDVTARKRATAIMCNLVMFRSTISALRGGSAPKSDTRDPHTSRLRRFLHRSCSRVASGATWTRHAWSHSNGSPSHDG